MGKIINQFHVERVSALLKDHQGKVVIGHEEAPADGNFQPTVVLNPSWSSPLMKDEIFGPILPVISYQKIEEAIKIIRDNEKPLVIYYFGYPWSCSRNKLEQETSSGALITNEVLFHMANPNLPFGGVGNSGYGKLHGFEGFKSFSNAKSILTKPALNVFPYN
jgi:aldehyde dehydrogenase (NAD+)